MIEALIESGFAKVAAGEWLTNRSQPASSLGPSAIRGLGGFIVPDRGEVCKLTSTADAWFSRAEAPFLTRLDALPDVTLKVVSSKLLLAPFESRRGAKSLKLVPFSFQRSLAVTHLQFGWAVMSTKSRTVRVNVEEGQTLSVRPESLVAWIGNDPTGFCPKLSFLDILLPRGPKNLVFSFHGPATVWIEGANEISRKRAYGQRRLA